MTLDALIGTWKLLSCEARSSDGRTLYPFGQSPRGVLVYDAAGTMAVQIMAPERLTFAAGDKALGSPDELKAAVSGYEAYFGTYSVDLERRAVTHRLQGSLFPNWVGGEQVRFFELEGATLTLRAPPVAYAGATLTGALIWTRVA
jgi:Lipocalin-like domain